MDASSLIVLLLALSALAYHLGRRRSMHVARAAGGVKSLHSLPGYYGLHTAMWCGIPALLVVALWIAFEPAIVTHLVVSAMPEEMRSVAPERLNLIVNDIRNIVSGHFATHEPDAATAAAVEHYKHLQYVSRMAMSVVGVALAMIGITIGWRYIQPRMRARNRVELIIKVFLILSSTVAIFTTIGIVLSVLFEALQFWHKIPFTDFVFGLNWSPQTAIREDQVGSSGSFGAIPLFAGTMLISIIAMLVAAPIGLFAAVYLAEYADRRVRAVAKPALEILAGIPTVVYGFFAALTVAPLLRDGGAFIGLTVSSESALAAGLVMGLMLIPFVSSLSDDVINAVPQSMRDGAYALGATRAETAKNVILPAALPGIVGGLLLAVSRAIGETMIVVMAAGLAANLTANPLEAVTTVTVQIVTLLVGDQEFDSAKTLAAFALGLMLFVVTLVLNIVALHIVRKYREQYE